MNKIKFLPWPLILGLAALALVRPVVSIVESQLDVSAPPAVPIAITVAISAVWIIVVGLTKRARHPVLTLLLTGLTYAVLSIALSGILSPILTGELQGPLAMPLAIIPVLLTNAIWGLITGTLALLLQRSRSHRSSARTSRHAAPPAARLCNTARSGALDPGGRTPGLPGACDAGNGSTTTCLQRPHVITWQVATRKETSNAKARNSRTWAHRRATTGTRRPRPPRHRMGPGRHHSTSAGGCAWPSDASSRGAWSRPRTAARQSARDEAAAGRGRS